MGAAKNDQRRLSTQDMRIATLAEIGSTVGVSASTVSKVLNGRADVASTTRIRVETALHLHGYHRTRKVRSPAPLLDLVFHELKSPWALEIIRGVEGVAYEEELNVVISECAGRQAPDRTWIDRILARQPTGVILVLSELGGFERAQLASRGIPFVVINHANALTEEVASVGATNWDGGLTATRHLLDLGHQRIGVISGPDGMLCSRARVDGYRTALETAGIPYDPLIIRAGNFDHDSGYVAGLELLQLSDRPTAIFSGNDLQALAVYRAAHALGLSIPRDLSVVGFDDVSLSSWAAPSLTTVCQPFKQMAEAAARLVIDIGRGSAPPTERLDLATRLVVRHSTAAPPRLEPYLPTA